MAQGERAEQPHPPQEAARSSDGRADREGQRAQVEGPGEGRARLRPPEGPDGADDPNRRQPSRRRRREQNIMVEIQKVSSCIGFRQFIPNTLWLFAI